LFAHFLFEVRPLEHLLEQTMIVVMGMIITFLSRSQLLLDFFLPFLCQPYLALDALELFVNVADRRLRSRSGPGATFVATTAAAASASTWTFVAVLVEVLDIDEDVSISITAPYGGGRAVTAMVVTSLQRASVHANNVDTLLCHRIRVVGRGGRPLAGEPNFWWHVCSSQESSGSDGAMSLYPVMFDGHKRSLLRVRLLQHAEEV
jgi:hypothetical protein